MKALKRKYRVSEVASHEYERQAGASKLILWRFWYAFAWSFLRNIF